MSHSSLPLALAAGPTPRFGPSRMTAALDRWLPWQERLVALTVLLVPVNWALGTTLAFVFATGLVLALSLVRFSVLETVLLVLMGALTLSLVLALGEGADADRVLAAIYNLAIIALFVLFLNGGRKLQLASDPRRDRRRGLYRAGTVGFAISLVVFSGVYVYGLKAGDLRLDFNTLVLGRLGELPGILKLYAKVAISIPDWSGTADRLRLVGFGIYATEGAFLFMAMGLFATIWASRRGLAWLVAVELAICAVGFAMGSRTLLAAYILSIGFYAGFARRPMGPALVVALPILVPGLAFALIEGPRLAADAFAAVNEARAGSSATRFLTYTLAIDMVRDTNLLTGLGIKPRDHAALGIPIGSHSSFVSQFTKGGLLALAIYGAFFALALRQVLRSVARLRATQAALGRDTAVEALALARLSAIYLFWCVTEDFDAPAHAAALGGLVLGLLRGIEDRAERLHAVPARGPFRSP